MPFSQAPKFTKTLFLAVNLALIITQTGSAAYFIDVEESHPHYRAIEALRTQEVVQGYLDPNSQVKIFKPQNPVNRAEALKMILLAQKKDLTNQNTETIFKDVSADQWFAPFVLGAYEIGIVKGYQDGEFKPERNVSLAEALKMILETAGVKADNIPRKQSVFSDVPDSAWFLPYVNYAQNLNVITGSPDGTLNPNRELTRAELAEIIFRFQWTQTEKTNFDLSLNWEEVPGVNADYSINRAPNWNQEVYNDLVVYWYGINDPGSRFFSQNNLSSTYLAVFQDKNLERLSQSAYFQKIKEQAAEKSLRVEESKINDLPLVKVYDSQISQRWHMFLPNNQILVVYKQVNSSASSYREIAEIEAMASSIKFQENNTSSGEISDDLLSLVRENILIENQGKAMLELLGDTKIIETDTIGVGTGPIDYYYSAKHDVTAKYERSADVILDLQTGERTDF